MCVCYRSTVDIVDYRLGYNQPPLQKGSQNKQFPFKRSSTSTSTTSMSSEDVDTHKMTQKIDRLPKEVLQDVSEIVDTIHPASLLAFACASKQCYAIASKSLFRTVKITIAHGKEPLHNVHAWEERLLRNNAFAHVRRLMLIFSPQGPARYSYLSLDPWEKGRENDTGLWSCWDSCLDGWPSYFLLSQMEPIPSHKWGPVIDLVGQLTGLVDLFCACREPFPPRLLQALHERPKFCRLHHYTFKLSNPYENSLTSNEEALVTSPCLYSIGCLASADDDSTPRLWRDLQSHALRRVHLTSRSNRIMHNVKHGLRPLPRESIQWSYQETPRCLSSSAVLHGAAGNFSALQVLKFNGFLLPGLSISSNLPSLVKLIFTCTTRPTELVPQTYWDELITLLRNLPNLTTLRVRDWKRDKSIAPGLNPRLKTLELRTWNTPGCPPLVEDHIHQLADLCPVLENLTIEVQRSRGDVAEVARYRSLGRLPRLRVLDLCLDASPPPAVDSDTVIEPWFDENDTEYLPGAFGPSSCQGHVRDVFLNSAIDKALARSIFEVIDSAKRRHSGRASPLPLERLELHAWGGAIIPRWSHIDYTQFDHLLAALKQVWVVEQDTRDDGKGVPRVDEVYWNANKSFFRKHHLDHVVKHGYWFGSWRRVWPAERKGVDWWDDWKSRPLALEMDAGGNVV